jgi:hypothetical protein
MLGRVDYAVDHAGGIGCAIGQAGGIDCATDTTDLGLAGDG